VNRRLGVLISGRGSNLQSIIDAVAKGALDATVAVVISNRTGAAGLLRARAAGIDTLVVSPRDHATRDAYDQTVAEALKRCGVGLVCLAGFMRLIGPQLLEAFPERILNIHPSLLPSFPGLNAQAQAIAHGVRVSGATVHFVTAALDDGPIVLQSAVPVADDDTAETLAARTLIEEHRIYPAAIATVLEGGWRIEGRRFIPGGSSGQPSPGEP
jgi:phosphoribosylglycinamide formyltransferase-1